MIFAAPWLLGAALLAVLAVAVAVELWASRRGADAADPLPSVLHASVVGGRVRLGTPLPTLPWRFALGLLLVALALGRPQWGVKPGDNPARPTIVIALDLSKSMLAADALPSRLEAARTIATRLVAQSPGADIGLIGFAGRAWLLAAPSADRGLLDRFLRAIHPDQVLVPGSDFAALLGVAVDAFGPDRTAATLVLLSDGEAEPTEWRHLLPRLKSREVQVVAIGFGTAAGAAIAIDGRTFSDPSGNIVRTRRNADVLREIAAATGGVYFDAAEAGKLAARVAALARQSMAGQGAPTTRADRFGWFLVPALLFLLWSAAVEWPAAPRLRRRRAWLVAPLALLVGADEPDPLANVKRTVSRIIAKPAPSADDYLALANATAYYGETHRQHTHPLQVGALQDGLAAVAAGAALEPARPDWAPLRTRLQSLLRPARTADDPEEGDGAADGSPVPPEDASDPSEAGYDPKGQPPDTRRVGGTQRSPSEQAEWRVPSLIKPAYTLEKLRASDSPGELFRLMQRQDTAPARKQGQTW